MSAKSILFLANMFFNNNRRTIMRNINCDRKNVNILIE